MKVTTWKMIGEHLNKKRDDIEERVIETSYRGWNVKGRQTRHLVCPFCRKNNLVFVWSFAGCGGKRCDCGAMLGHKKAYNLKENIVPF